MNNEHLKTAALRFVNDVRKQQGREPLSELPKGAPGGASRCPIARAIAVQGCPYTFVGLASAGWVVPARRFLGISVGFLRHRSQILEPLVREFVQTFDTGKFPELIEEGHWLHTLHAARALHAKLSVPDTVPEEWVLEGAGDAV